MITSAGHLLKIWPGDTPPPAADLKRLLHEADGALTMVTDQVSDEMLSGSPRLLILANMAVGYDNINPVAAAAAGVWTTNTPGILAETTADLAWALLMAVARQVPQSERDTRAGGWKTWSPTAFLGSDIHGATIGIIGLGEIGTAMARRARGFGMRILYASGHRKPDLEAELGLEPASLDELLTTGDYISLHVPLNESTKALLGAREFALMKPTSILINTARGGVIAQEALVEALRFGRPGGAGLDVTDPEPLPLEHDLYSFENVVITPHIGSASLATRSRMAELAAENVIEVLAGRAPLTPVNYPAQPRPAMGR